jgi:hypothetical protein
MGNAVKSFAKAVAKAAISGAGSAIPIIGGPLASWINSKFAKGSYDIGNPGVAIPDGAKTKAINTPAQLKALINANPAEAKAAGLSVDMINSEVKEAKEQAKAVGGMVKMRTNIPTATVLDKAPSKAVGGKIMPAPFHKKEMMVEAPSKAVGGHVKKPRTAAQLAATKKLVEANRKRRAEK